MRPELDIEHWDDHVPSDTIIADGAWVNIRVRNGQLEIADGLNSAKRTRVLTRAQRDIRHVVNLGRYGSVTLEAFRWMRGASLTYTGEAPFPHLDWLAVAAQVRGCEAAQKHLIKAKLAGQVVTLDMLGASGQARQVEKIHGTDDLLLAGAESAAAMWYWQGWGERVSLPWSRADAQLIPAHWLSFDRRNSWSTNRNARNPVNALLNFTYKVAESATRRAITATGLSPVHGLFHANRDGRDAFVFDLIEPVRPVADWMLADWLRKVGRFDRRWVSEGPAGVVSVQRPVTHVISGWEQGFYRKALEHAIETVRILRSGGSP